VGTEEGRILGTPVYMSQEQMRGQKVDKQTDIWAFGCVLYELLTGAHAFQRESSTDTIAAVLEREPDWRALPPATPAAVRQLLRRCLQKDKDRRLCDIGDARIEIEEALAGSTAAAEPSMAVSSTKRGWLGWAIALVLAAALISVVYFNRAIRPPEIRVEVSSPSTTDALSFAISPDGQRLVFSALNEGKS